MCANSSRSRCRRWNSHANATRIKRSWGAAATFARTTEERAREEVEHVAYNLERTLQELTADNRRHLNETAQRAQALQAELERQRELVAGLTRELEDAAKAKPG